MFPFVILWVFDRLLGTQPPEEEPAGRGAEPGGRAPAGSSTVTL
jgi:hypothetical protein